LIKPIVDFPHYYVDDKGKVYSDKSGKLKEMKPWQDSRKRYLIIALCNYGEIKKCLVHRLVAQTFIPNPNNLPEVNHKNYNTQDNSVENLEWCTRLENSHHAFLKHSPVRNFRRCDLYYKSEYIGEFQSVCAAARYAYQAFGASKSGLMKYYSTGGATIIKKE
jgi:hypothetical protein